MPPRRIAPSILAADFARLGAQVAEVVDAGATRHPRRRHGRPLRAAAVDGPAGRSARCATSAVERRARRPPDDRARPSATSPTSPRPGAHTITVHAEATPHVNYAVQRSASWAARAGVAVCPSTPLAIFEEVDVDLALCMTVNPGLGRPGVHPGLAGQDRAGCARCSATAPSSRSTAASTPRPPAPCADAGATLFVAGHAPSSARPIRPRPTATIAAAAGVWPAVRSPGPAQGRPSSSEPVARTVLIVDDHPTFRSTARLLLESEGFDVVGEAPDGAERHRGRRRAAPRSGAARRQPPRPRRLRRRRRASPACSARPPSC